MHNDILHMGRPDNAEFMSDVFSESEVSNPPANANVNVSTRLIEQKFKDKFQILRNAYEDRIRDMSVKLQETFANLAGDEVLQEMRHDKLSSAFIPAHLVEVLNAHLKSDREAHIHRLNEKLASLELENNNLNNLNENSIKKIKALESEFNKSKKMEAHFHTLKDKYISLERQYNELLQASSTDQFELSSKITELHSELTVSKSKEESLALRLSEKNNEIAKLRSVYEERSKEVSYLEKSMLETTREIGVFESSEKREKSMNAELREQLHKVTEHRDIVLSELLDLKSRFRYTSEELERTQMLIQTRGDEDENNRKRINGMMIQVENMLSQEASESTAAVTSLLQKLKQVKQKLSLEIAREKHTSELLQEEVNTFRKQREDLLKDIQISQDELKKTKEQLKEEINKNISFQKQINELRDSDLKSKSICLEMQARAQLAEDKIVYLEKLKDKELSLAENKLKLDAERLMESERSQIDRRTAAYHLHYQNELGQIKNQVRQSLDNSLAFPSYFDPRNSYESQNNDNEQIIKMYRDRLEEAAVYINKLKSMVYDNPNNNNNNSNSNITQYKEKIKSLEYELIRLKEEHAEMLENLQTNHGNELDSIENKYQDEISRLKLLLEETQTQALHDQEEDMKEINNMKTKFEKLIKLYSEAQQSIDKNVNNKNNSFQSIEETLSDFKSDIENRETRKLTPVKRGEEEKDNKDKDKDKDKERGGTEVSNQTSSAELLKLKKYYKDKLQEIYLVFGQTKDQVNQMKGQFEHDFSFTKDSIKTYIANHINRIHQHYSLLISKNQNMMIEEINTNKQNLEARYNGLLTEKELFHFNQIKSVRREMLEKINNSNNFSSSFTATPTPTTTTTTTDATATATFTPNSYGGRGKETYYSDTSFYDAILGNKRNTNGDGNGGDDDKSILQLDSIGSIIRLELIIKTIINALVGMGILNQEVAASLEEIAISNDHIWNNQQEDSLSKLNNHSQGSKRDHQLSAFYNLLIKSLSQYIETNTLTEQKEESSSSSRCKFLESQFIEIKVLFGLDSSSENSFDSSLQDSIDLQSFNLIKINIKKLLSTIDDMKSKNLLEIQQLKTEHLERESQFKTTYENEMAYKLQIDEARISNLEAKLRSEQIRRQSAQAQLLEVDAKCQKTIYDSEEKYLKLQKDYDVLQIENSKLKYELFHHN